MIDFLLKDRLTMSEIEDFLSPLISSKKKLKIISLEDFYNSSYTNEELDGIYFCVVMDVYGDASLLLQLYRTGNNNIESSIIRKAEEDGISVYIPFGDEWLFVNDKGKKKVFCFESEKGFYFKELG